VTIRRLYLGDNLEILRERVPDASADLVYLDPPFGSGRNYVLGPDSGAGGAKAAFSDVWRWDSGSEEALSALRARALPALADAAGSLARILGKGPLAAYLVMMAPRIAELARALKPAGSLYLHCDPSAAHCLRLLLDAALGPGGFRSEIVWKRTSSHNGARRWGPVHDVILFYAKGPGHAWNRVTERHGELYLARNYREDPLRPDRGRYKLSDLTGAGLRRGDSGAPWRGVDPSARGRHRAVPTPAKLPAWL
jgi:hypothetical protein